MSNQALPSIPANPPVCASMPSVWISRGESLPTGTRVLAFSPCYPLGDPMRHRMMDAQFFGRCLEASHWLDVHALEPVGVNIGNMTESQRDAEIASVRAENERLRFLLQKCAASDYMGEVRALVDGMDD